MVVITMIYFQLFIEFFKAGLFAVGGGIATLPFLYHMSEQYTWLSSNMIPDMLALAQTCPGAVGVNMAAFAGYHAAGLPGEITAVVGLVIPAVLVIVVIVQFLNKYKENFYVDSVFYGLRPVACALICSTAIQIFRVSLINLSRFQLSRSLLSLFEWKALPLFALFVFLMRRYKTNPVLYIVIAAAVGIIFQF